jgi:hypothetical protein
VLCPVNFGWVVDANGDPTPPPQPPDDSSVRFRDELRFIAQAPVAAVRIEACDRSSALGSAASSSNGDALRVGIDDFAIVQKDFWQQHHVPRAAPIDPSDCYNDGGGQSKSVGSVFDRSSAQSSSCEMPFADSFDLAATQGRWVLDGAEFKNGRLLIADALDDLGDDNGRFQCSSATVRVGNLVPGRDYIIDFSWSVSGPGFDGDSGEEGFAKVQLFVNPVTVPNLGPRPFPAALRQPCP